MKLLIHADDLGNSRSISDNILDCFGSHLPLNGASIMANGHAFDYAAEEFNKLNGNYRLAVHINLMEGPACLSIDEVPLLVDKQGYFRHSFQSLFAAYYVSSKNRKAIAAQVKAEMRAQMQAVAKYLPPNCELHVDSHQHFHMIPFIFKLLMELHQEIPIGYIRIAREPFFFHIKGKGILNYFGLNLIKHLLLNFLAKKCTKLLKGTHIKSPDFFVGVLFTGNITIESVTKALTVLNTKHPNQELVIEILMHPGGASKEDASLWKKYPHLVEYYCSEFREKEKALLKSPALARVVKHFEKPRS
ncbi:MAG: hypothetical protein AXW14_16900 [Alteromonas sp. Nap_26]|nr:MAG: hypothetical protein AXW14_16900 [Alteromonas sp. Nap_26]